MLKVINGKTSGFIGKDKLYIGRANGSYLAESPLANPFIIGRDGDRALVIQKYRQWLWHNLKPWKDSGTVNEVVQELLMIRDRVKEGKHTFLVCWCSPQPCHGDIIIKAVHWLISN
ncbi:MAG: hypothetical protein RLZZ338_3964 [Cyanobacteriota bacterium]|jgi:hypothetical protein